MERRAEGVALIDTSGRCPTSASPAAARSRRPRCSLAPGSAPPCSAADGTPLELLPATTAAERLAARARRIDAALPSRGLVTELALSGRESASRVSGEGGPEPGETRYPFVTDSWLRGRRKEITGEYGAGFAAGLRGDPDRLLDQALDLLAAMSLITRVDGGALALPLLARYRGVTARVRTRTAAQLPAQRALSTDETAKDPTP